MFQVTEKAMRPANNKKACFYCNQAIGQNHFPTCVLRMKKVKVKAVITYEIEVPNNWTGDDVEFHRNESSWCSSNIIGELEKYDEERGCLCPYIDYEYIEDCSLEYLKEV